MIVERFSALQRAENSSIAEVFGVGTYAFKFQCSSASRKFLNFFLARVKRSHYSFSALQRAENSSIQYLLQTNIFFGCFSALQRAENSSISQISSAQVDRLSQVSVLFSEPKIPQYYSPIDKFGLTVSVSVLFSEPKIPQ